MHTRRVSSGTASSCYFRTSVDEPYRKALVQIEERCNLHCAHCFVSATREGSCIDLCDVVGKVIPRLIESRVTRVTLTGGEPTIHPDFVEVVAAFSSSFEVGICTNGATLLEEEWARIASLGGIHVNVSLDGFRAESHGRFRGDRGSFDKTIETIVTLGRLGILQGLLCTPNNLAEDQEYRELCEFAVRHGAKYVLMNPLGSMGRGVKALSKLGTKEAHLQRIRQLTMPPDDSDLDVVHIRFPNVTDEPLGGCEAGRIIYVFASGDVTVCPYLVFAARTPQSLHSASEFIVGNILDHEDIDRRLDAYAFHDRYRVGNNSTCTACALASTCGKGCPAAVVAAGGRIGDVDAELCPVTTNPHLSLPLVVGK